MKIELSYLTLIHHTVFRHISIHFEYGGLWQRISIFEAIDTSVDLHYILTRNLIQRNFIFPFSLSIRLHVMCYLFCLAIVWVIYCIAWGFSLKTIKIVNLYFSFYRITCFSWFFFSDFLIAATWRFSSIRIFDQWVCTSNDLLIVISDWNSTSNSDFILLQICRSMSSSVASSSELTDSNYILAKLSSKVLLSLNELSLLSVSISSNGL